MSIQVQRGVSVIPKSANAGRIEENTKIFDFSLSDEDMKDIGSFNRGEEGRCLFIPMDKDHPHFPFKGDF